MDASPDTPPRLGTPVAGESDDDARRRLCLAAMAGAPGLLRYAARFAPSLEDAEDAYQRGMEVALTKGPIGPPEEFIAWLHVVIRNEATTLARRRSRETPAGDDIVTVVDERGSADAREPSAVAEWRDRYRTLQDAMTSLTEAERVCLLLRTAGVSRAEIGSMTGYTDRKVERSIVKARKRLHAWHLDLARGERCIKLQEALEHVADREATAKERKAVSKHVRHCGTCRATLRARRQTNAGITVLVPVALVGAGAAGLAVPDASPAVDIFDRSAARLTVSVGQAWQAMLDLPSLLSARMGAGALAITVAGVAGVPVVAKTVNTDRPATEPIPARVSTTAQATSTTDPYATSTTGLSPEQERAMAEIERIRAEADARRRTAEARARAQREEQREAARRRAAEQRRAAARAAAPAPTQAAASPSTSSPQSTPAASPAAQPQLEFGP